MVEIALHQTYALLSLLFSAVFPIVWEKGIRPRLSLFLDRLLLVESFSRRNLFLNQLNQKHITITIILIGIGVIFGILYIF